MYKKILAFVLAVLLLVTNVFAVPSVVISSIDSEIELNAELLVSEKSVVTRDDGTWLFPVDKQYYQKFSDWCCCPGKDKCVLCNTTHSSLWGDTAHSNQSGHNGIDLATPIGTTVRASASGIFYKDGSNSHSRGYYVVIEHPLGNGLSYYSAYQHLNKFESGLENGDTVQAGDVIGYSGGSGAGSGVHLHFGIVIGSSGKGLNGPDIYELWGSSNPWATRPDQTQGRIVNNPADNLPTSTAEASLDAIKTHKGSVHYTFDKTKVNIGFDGASSGDSSSTTLASTTEKAKYTTDEDVTITWNTYTGATSYGLTITRKTGSSWDSREIVYNSGNLTGNSVNVGNFLAGEYRFNMGAYSSNGTLLDDYSEITYFEVISGADNNESSTDIYPYSSAYKSSKYYTALKNADISGNEAADIVNVALSQIGYHEGDSTSELGGTNASGTGQYTEYAYWFGTQVKGNSYGHYADWCAMFVSWCARQAEISTSTISNSAYAKASDTTYCFANLSYFSRESGTPKKGDLIFFDYSDVSGEWDHVGIVKSVDSTHVTTIEGNASKQVKSQSYALSDTYIRGYGRPSYQNDVADDPENEEIEGDVQWSEWSDWSENVATASSYKKVETKTQYGYYHYMHVWTDTGYTGAYPVKDSSLFTSDASEIVEYHEYWNDTQLSQVDSWTYGGVKYAAYENLHNCLVGTNLSSVNHLFSLNKTRILYRYSNAIFTITYEANGGTGAPASQTKVYGTNLTLSSAVPERDGYTFKGWSTSASGSVEYAPGDTYTENRAATLYAVWEAETITFSTSMQAYLNLEGLISMSVCYKFSDMDSINYADYLDKVGLLVWDAENAPEEEAATYENCTNILEGAVYNSVLGRFETTTEGIVAKKLGDRLCFRAYCLNEDGTYSYTKYIKNYSPKTYCYNQIRDNADDEATIELMASILNYGAAAQKYFKYRTDDLMNSDLPEELK